MWLLLLLIGLQCWAALRLLRGERWARFVLSAMAIMSVGGALGAMTDDWLSPAWS
jgi:hypothetical protein